MLRKDQLHLRSVLFLHLSISDEFLRPIVVPFIHDHHLMLQHDNARPHVARICTQFLEAENIPVLARPAHSPDTSPIEHVWDALDRRIRQRVPVPANIQQLPLKRSGPTSHRPQSTTWSTLCEGDVLHCVRQMVVTPDTDWFTYPPNTVKLHIIEWPFIVSRLRHTCVIIMLSNHHLDMPHLWGGWLSRSLTQI